MKYTYILTLGVIALLLTNCAPAPKIPYDPDVRSMSATTNGMFAHMVGGIGGVAFADEVVEGTNKDRKLIKIESLSDKNYAGSGIERWTVQHANGRKATYLVTWQGAQFEVVPEKRIKPRT